MSTRVSSHLSPLLRTKFTESRLYVILAFFIALFVADSTTLTASEDKFSEGEKLFALKVKPLIQQKCFNCHGGEELKAGLNLTSRENILKGSKYSDNILIPGDAENSLMYIATTWTDPDYEMPPKEPDRLTQEQTWQIRDWINAGAPWPTDEVLTEIGEQYAEGVIVQTSGGLDEEWTNRRYDEKNLWAYQPIRDPYLPEDMQTSHPVDVFINKRIKEFELEPAGLADRPTLIRRASFDLIGLPPSPAEIEAFITDPDPDEKAFAKVIDRLLADSRYGEQWGKHWLDVVRYADSSGFSNDYERPSAWRYRDYVIRSFNQDKAFDRFIMEQIAGDELDPNNPDALIATGFLRTGPWEHTSMSVARVTRQQYLDDITDNVGQVFLSHPLSCARCHDHKFDPIPTRDYYRIQAVFSSTYFADRELPFQENETLVGLSERDTMLRRIAHYKEIRDALQEKQDKAREQWCIEKGIPNKTREELSKMGVAEELLPPRDLGLSEQELGIKKVARTNVSRTGFEIKKFEPFVMSVYSGLPPKDPQSSGAMLPMPNDRSVMGEPGTTHILTGGNPFAYAEEVTPGVMSALPGSNDRLEKSEFNSIPESFEGRRLAFAKWLASPENSIVARSMVNRIWHYHFGQGIVDTPNNFGAMGGKPSHPSLLDYLASRFIDSGWSIKSMHRLIMSSEAYRRSTEYHDRDLLGEKDPYSKSFAVFRPRRLSAEELRDSMLRVSRELSPTVGGLPALPEINQDVATQPRLVMGSFAASYEPAKTPEERNRRSIYAKKVRGLRNPFMEVFNQPSPDESCEARRSSTVTPQVLSLFNGKESLHRSIAAAIDLLDTNDSRQAVIQDLFQRAYGRMADVEELQLCLDHWEKMERRHADLEFEPRVLPSEVKRTGIEEMSGATFEFTEVLYGYEDYIPDRGLADVDARTRALADICLVVFNSNEFSYIY